MSISEIHFLTSPPTPLLQGEGGYITKAKIRYRQADQECSIKQSESGYTITFTQEQRAIAAGQIVAFYDGEELWGSGVIE